MMHFRHKSVADSVVERITEISQSIRTDTPLPESKGAATVHLERGDNGDLLVTKTFENGEPEIMTISGKAPTPEIPAGFVNVTPPEQQQPIEQQLDAGVDAGGVVENAALGGDSINALLRT